MRMRGTQVADHTRANSGGRPYGLIRPEDATGGWELAGCPEEWWLTRNFGELDARIKATTPTTCSWWIGRPDGSLVREASVRSVDEAKSAAEAFVQDRNS
ncbi:hypothetical protein [Nocardia terpenica]|uniref:hypothetical protein n=1 Tax=Nocardia terpenica TaxID=455432 RepID=UPI0012FD3427|nr:hypothetical protein [Nocardia terpenica]